MQAVRNNPTAIILAAGPSKRMGKLDKLLLPIDGQALVLYVVELACEWADPVIVVTTPAPYNEAIVEQLEGTPTTVVENVGHHRGMGTSIAAGVSASRLDSTGYMVMLGDMPSITSRTIELLFRRFSKDATRIVVPDHDGKYGHPVIFPPTFRTALERLDGEEGLSEILEEYQNLITPVPVNDPGVVIDIDNPADYRSAILRK